MSARRSRMVLSLVGLWAACLAGIIAVAVILHRQGAVGLATRLAIVRVGKTVAPRTCESWLNQALVGTATSANVGQAPHA
jgi:hypothetical protein